MTYLSVCSGIEAATVAWHPLGWQPWAFAEVDKFPSAVLAHHYQNVPNLGDMTKFQEWPDAAIDVLVGGTPCQSFSVAGLREGLDDPRGSLMLVYLAIARRYRPRWVVWENVPGVLSSDDGRAFGTLLRGLADLGYGFAYRVLDAQHFGLAQRRQRVFVVGYLGDWRRAAAVLFERASLSGHPAPSREAGQDVTATVTSGPSSRGSHRQRSGDARDRLITPVVGALTARMAKNGAGANDEVLQNRLIAYGGNNTAGPIDVATAVRAKGGTGHGDFESKTFIAHSLRADGFDASEDGTGRGTPLVPVAHAFDARQSDVIQYGDQSGPLDTNGHSIGVLAFDTYNQQLSEQAQTLCSRGDSPGGNAHLVPAVLAFDTTQMTSAANRSNPKPGDPCHPLAAGAHAPAVAFQSSQSGVREVETHATLDANNGSRRHNGVAQGMQVRRLTPRECERLQGFSDDYTLINHRGKPAADGPRYKALGNSMAVPCMRWIGQRIALVDAISTTEAQP